MTGEAAWHRYQDERGAPCACTPAGQMCLAHFGLLPERGQLAVRTRLGIGGALLRAEARDRRGTRAAR